MYCALTFREASSVFRKKTTSDVSYVVSLHIVLVIIFLFVLYCFSLPSFVFVRQCNFVVSALFE